MPARPHFDAPPLVEAVYDCFAQPGAQLDLEELERKFFARFPDYSGPRDSWQFVGANIAFKGGEVSAAPSVPQVGVRRWNADRSRAVLLGAGVLAMNVVPPYGHVEDHLPHLRDLLSAYFELAQPRRIAWLGQRYINQVTIEFAERLAPFKLFTLAPNLPEARALMHPETTVQLEAARTNVTSALTTLSLSAKTPSAAVYTLDIYGRTSGEVPNSAQTIVDWHSATHEIIIDAFLSSITDEARKRFKERTP